MKFSGPLGMRRPFGIAPLAKLDFAQEIQGQDSFNSEVEDIIDERNIDIDTQDPDELQEVAEELARRTFPESERRQERMVACLDSNWATEWEDGFTESSDMGDRDPLEELSTRANACAGMTEANTIGP